MTTTSPTTTTTAMGFKFAALSLLLSSISTTVHAQDAPFCPTGRELFFDTFSNGSDGWNQPTKTYGGFVGKALGPFAAGSPAPTKTYSVNADSAYVHVEFDLLRMDSWDSTTQWGYDSFGFTVGDDFVDVGYFPNSRVSEVRSGTSSAGVSWKSTPLTGNINIGNTNGSFRDQIHRFSLVVPNTLFADGNLKLTMNPILTQAASDESAAFDNIRVSECGTPQLSYCSSQQETELDTFDSGNDGWSNPKLASVNEAGQFLGRYAVGDADPSKTFTVGTHDYAQVQLDFLRLDSWDATAQWGYDTFAVEINGEMMDMGRPGETGTTGYSQNGIMWIATAKTNSFKMGNTNQRFNDQIHLITCYVPPSLMPDGTIDVTFHANVNSGTSDESAGYDNIRVTVFDGCDADAPPPPVRSGPADARTCTTSTEISRDTFDTGNDGWSNARLSTLDAVGQYLGNYANNQAEPAKTFQIDSTTDVVRLNFDFIELDSWDSTQQWGYDTLQVRFNGRTVDLGTPAVSRAGDDVPTGVQWATKILIDSTDLGGNGRYKDRVLSVAMIIPKSIFSQ